MLAALLALLGAAPTGVSLDAASPCAPHEALSRELQRMGLAFGDGGDLVLTLAPEAETFALHLRNQSGTVLLTRTLRGGSCDDAGVAAALIVARYVQSISVPLTPAPPPPVIPPTPPAPPAPPAPPPKPIKRAPPPPHQEATRPALQPLPSPSVPPPASPASATEFTEEEAAPIAVRVRPPPPPPRAIAAAFEGLLFAGIATPDLGTWSPMLAVDLGVSIGALRMGLVTNLLLREQFTVIPDPTLPFSQIVWLPTLYMLPSASYCLREDFRVCVGAQAGVRWASYAERSDGQLIAVFPDAVNAQVVGSAALGARVEFAGNFLRGLGAIGMDVLFDPLEGRSPQRIGPANLQVLLRIGAGVASQ